MVSASSEPLVIAVHVPQGCGGEGRGAEQSPLQTCSGRQRENPENEGSENLTLIPRKSSRVICEQQRGGRQWSLKEKLT